MQKLKINLRIYWGDTILERHQSKAMPREHLYLNFPKMFAKFSDKKYYVLKRLFEPATSCVGDQDATTEPATHR